MKQQCNEAKPPDLTALEDDAERVQEEIQELEKEQKKVRADLADEKEKLGALKKEVQNLERQMEDCNEEHELREKMAKCEKSLEKKEEIGRLAQQKKARSAKRQSEIDEILANVGKVKEEIEREVIGNFIIIIIQKFVYFHRFDEFFAVKTKV